MIVNFSKFKKQSSDKDSTILKHPDGHTITINHAALSPKMRKQLTSLPMEEEDMKTDSGTSKVSGPANPKLAESKKAPAMANGGRSGTSSTGCVDQYGSSRPCTPDDYTAAANKSAWSANTHDKSKEGGDPAAGGNSIPGVQAQAKGGAVSAMDDGGDPMTDPTADLPADNAAPAWSTPPAPDAATESSPSSPAAAIKQWLASAPSTPQEAVAQDAAAKMIPGAAAGNGNVAPRTASVAAPETTDAGMARSPSSPPQSAPSDDTNPFSAANQTAIGGVNQQIAGKQAEASGLNQQNTAATPVISEQAKADEAAKYEFAAHVDHLNKVQDQLTQAISSGQIDPNRYIDNMSTGGRIATTIGVILGGMGGGLTGQGNPALDFLNRNIDRDIDAQKTQLGNNKTLLEANMRQYGNMNAAADITRLQTLTMYEHKLAATAATYNNPIITARAQQAIGELQQKKADIQKQAAMTMTLAGAQKSGNPANTIATLRYMNPEMAKEMESRYVPGVGMATVPVPAEVRQQMLAHQKLDSAAQDLMQWTKTHSTIVPGTSDYNVGLSKSQNLQQLIRHGQLQTVYREGEQPLLDKMVNGNPAGLLKGISTEPKLQELLRNNKQQYGQLGKAYGLNMPGTQTYTPKPPVIKK